MRNIFKAIVTILLINIGILFVKADNIPTITVDSIKVGDNVIVENDNKYTIESDIFTFYFNTDSYNEDYCVFTHLIETRDYKTICNYNEINSVQFVNKLYATNTLEYGFFKKTDALRVSSIEYLEFLNLDRFNDNRVFITNTKNTYLKFISFTDASGNTITKNNDIYEFEKEKQYNVNFEVVNKNGNVTYNYNQYFEEYPSYNHYYNKNGTMLINNNTVSIPLSFEDLDDLDDLLSLNVWIYEKYEDEDYTRSNDSFYIRVLSNNATYFGVDLKYKDFNKSVESPYPVYYSFDSRYYNEDHPLVIDIEPHNYNNATDNINIVFYKRTLVNCENECIEERVPLYEKSVTINTNEINHIEINDYVPMIYSYGDYAYYLEISDSVYSIKYEFEYKFGIVESFAFLKSEPYSLMAPTGDGIGNYRYKGYALAGFLGEYTNVIFKANDFINENDYKVKIIRDKIIGYNDETTDEWIVTGRPSSLEFETIVNGSLLNNNYFYLPMNKNGSDYVSLYVTDLDDNLLFQREVNSDREMERINHLYVSENDNVLIRSYQASIVAYIKEGTKSLTINFEAGHEYDNNKEYRYVVLFHKVLKYETVSAKKLNDGFSVTVDLSDYTKLNDWDEIQFEIIGDNNFSTVEIEMVSTSEFNKIKNGEFFNFTQSQLESMANRVDFTNVLFVDDKGKDVKKNVSYTVEYYKDDVLSDTETINESIPYIQEGIDIDTTKVNISNKYKGYNFVRTSKTDYDEETGEYYLKQIKEGDTLKVYYEKGNVGYRIEYYYNEKLDNTLTVTDEKLLGTTINTYENKIKLGYKFSKTENNPLLITEEENNNVMKVYYVTDPEQTHKLSYKVEYYKDNVLTDTDEVVKTVQLLDNTMEVDKTKINTTNKYAGYKYKNSNIPDRVEDDGIIKIYYEKDEFNYLVEYYYNKVKDENLTLSKKALYNDVIEEYKDELKNGFKLDKIENHPLTINYDESKNIMKVYYITDENNSERVHISGFKLEKGNNNSLIISYKKDEFAVGYKIYRSESKKGKYKEIANITNDVYTDSGLTYGKTYYYKVKVYNKVNSETTDVIGKKVVPNKVDNLTITSAGTNNIKLLWEKVNVTGYQIQRSTDNKKWTNVKTITKNSTLSFNNKKLSSNKTYYYRIRAYKTVKGKKIYGFWSDIVSTKTAPVKPKLSLSLKSLTEMRLTISSVKGANKYEVEKSIDGKTYSKLEDLSSSGNYDSSGLEIGKTYYFRVRACNLQERCSSWVVKSLRQTPKSPNISLKTSSKKVTVTLESIDGDLGYEVYRSNYKNKKYSLIKSSSTNELTFDNSTKKGKIYYYKARSYKIVNGKKVYSPYSKIKSIKSK